MRKIWLIIFVVLIKTSFSQNLEVQAILSDTKDTVNVYFSQDIRTIANSTEFKLKLDSLEVDSNDIWFVYLNMFVKTTDCETYISSKFLYPLAIQWDTILQGRVLSYGVLESHIKRADSLEPLLKNLDILESNINFFPNCTDNLNFIKLHKAYNWLFTINKNILNDYQISSWFAQKLTNISANLFNKDCPQAALIVLYRAKKLVSNDLRINLMLAEFFYNNAQYVDSYRLLKSCYQSIPNTEISEIHQLANNLIIKLLDLAKQTYNKKLAYYFISYADTLRTLFTLNQVDLDTELVKITTNYFEQQYSSTAANLLEEDLNTNLKQFENLIIFYLKNKIYLNDTLYRTKLGNLLQNLIQNIDIHIQTGNYKTGITTLEQLLEFCTTKCKYADNKILSLVFGELFRARLTYAKFLIEQDSLQKAKIQLQAANNAANHLNADLLDNQIKIYDLSLEYIKHTQNIINFYLKRHNYDSAYLFTNYLTGSNYKFFSKKQIDSLRKSIVKQQASYMLDTLTAPGGLASVNHIFLKYNLFSDSVITNKFYNKLPKIVNEKCIRQQKRFLSIFKLADSLVNKHLYLAARDTLEKFSRVSANCNIDFDTIQKYIIYYRHPIVYQKCLDSFYEQTDQKNWKSALDELLCASKYFKTHRLYIYNLQAPDLFSLITQQDVNFVLYANKRLINADSLELALNLLEFLRTKHIKASQVKELQTELGYRLALRDFLLHPTERRLIYKRQQIKKNRYWYRFLLKAYFRQQKKMRYFRI